MNFEPPQRGFRTFLQLIVLAIGAVVIVRLSQGVTNSFTQASVSDEPQNVKVTNLSDTSVAINWSTSKPTTEYVVFRNGLTKEQKYFTTNLRRNHQITLTSLIPDTKYEYRLGVGPVLYDDNGEAYTFNTLPKFVRGHELKVFGQVLTENQTLAENALVNLTLKDMDNVGSIGLSTTVSTITDKNGVFFLNLADVQERAVGGAFVASSGDSVELTVAGSGGGVASLLLNLQSLQPTPTIELSGTLRLKNLMNEPQVKGSHISIQSYEVSFTEKLQKFGRGILIKFIY